MNHVLILLAQGDFVTPMEKYFSFFVLGVLLCVGYLLLRFLGRKKKRDEGERLRIEEELFRVEAEARAAHAARQQKADATRPRKDESGEPLLGLTPEQEMERQRVKEMLEGKSEERP